VKSGILLRETVLCDWKVLIVGVICEGKELCGIPEEFPNRELQKNERNKIRNKNFNQR
jgi:hypothetical protein